MQDLKARMEEGQVFNTMARCDIHFKVPKLSLALFKLSVLCSVLSFLC